VSWNARDRSTERLPLLCARNELRLGLDPVPGVFSGRPFEMA
jgi:hypothetical protein